MLDKTKKVSLQMNTRTTLLHRIKDSERMLNALIDNLNGMLYCFLYDMPWTMVYVGKGCEPLTGYEPESFSILFS